MSLKRVLRGKPLIRLGFGLDSTVRETDKKRQLKRFSGKIVSAFRLMVPKSEQLEYNQIMLTHIVCWKYKTEVTEKDRAAHIERLRALPDLIPDILSFNVGRDILHLDRSFDTGLVATYPDRAALDFYTDHPEHQKVAAFGKEIADRVISVDFIDG